MAEDMDLASLVPPPPVDDKKRLAIGVTPARINENRVSFNAWGLIYPFVEELATQSCGEYTPWQVFRAIDSGEVSLHVAYMNDTGQDLVSVAQQGFMWDRLIREKEKGFVGYFLTRTDIASVHIWHAYIVKEHRNSEVFKLAFDHLLELAKYIKSPAITFSSNRAGWGSVCERLGFKELYTIYRHSLEN